MYFNPKESTNACLHSILHGTQDKAPLAEDIQQRYAQRDSILKTVLAVAEYEDSEIIGKRKKRPESPRNQSIIKIRHIVTSCI